MYKITHLLLITYFPPCAESTSTHSDTVADVYLSCVSVPIIFYFYTGYNYFNPDIWGYLQLRFPTFWGLGSSSAPWVFQNNVRAEDKGIPHLRGLIPNPKYSPHLPSPFNKSLSPSPHPPQPRLFHTEI